MRRFRLAQRDAEIFIGDQDRPGELLGRLRLGLVPVIAGPEVREEQAARPGGLRGLACIPGGEVHRLPAARGRVLAAALFAHESAAFGVHVSAGIGGADLLVCRADG